MKSIYRPGMSNDFFANFGHQIFSHLAVGVYHSKRQPRRKLRIWEHSLMLLFLLLFFAQNHWTHELLTFLIGSNHHSLSMHGSNILKVYQLAWFTISSFTAPWPYQDQLPSPLPRWVFPWPFSSFTYKSNGIKRKVASWESCPTIVV